MIHEPCLEVSWLMAGSVQRRIWMSMAHTKEMGINAHMIYKICAIDGRKRGNDTLELAIVRLKVNSPYAPEQIRTGWGKAKVVLMFIGSTEKTGLKGINAGVFTPRLASLRSTSSWLTEKAVIIAGSSTFITKFHDTKILHTSQSSLSIL